MVPNIVLVLSLLLAFFHMGMARLPDYMPVAMTDWGQLEYNPVNVHRKFVRSFGDCDPWCRAHCATKRYPEFCFFSGPCIQNCWRVLRA